MSRTLRTTLIFSLLILPLFSSTALSEIHTHEPRRLDFLKDDRLYSVSKLHGLIRFNPDDLIENNRKFLRFDTGIRPWSAYWHPQKEPDFIHHSKNAAIDGFQYDFENNRIKKVRKRGSILNKYDSAREELIRALQQFNPVLPESLANASEKSEAWKWDTENYFNPRATPWEGLCSAWAYASVTMKEPTQSKTIGRKNFSVSDQKALLMRTFENVKPEFSFGQKQGWDKGTWEADILPHEFHRFVEVYVVGQKRPFVMDYDYQKAVWFAPAYMVDFVFDWDPDSEENTSQSEYEIINVTAQVHVARRLDPEIFSDKSRIEALNETGLVSTTFEYTYELIAKWTENNELVVTWGNWTGRSKQDHPDFVELPPKWIRRKETSAMIDKF